MKFQKEENAGVKIYRIQEERLDTRIAPDLKTEFFVDFNEENQRVGRVYDVFGPTVSPYVEVSVEAVNPQLLVGNVLYFPSSARRNKRRKNK